MKPPKFHVGQAVVCVIPVSSWDADDEVPPRKNQIYTVSELDCDGKTWFIELVEKIGVRWEEDGFAPAELLPDEALATLLEETLEPVTV